LRLIDKLAWIEIQDQKILGTLSKGKDVFYIPGGKREPGESDTQALVREVKEELDVDLKLASIQYLDTFEAQAHSHAEGVMVKMTCYTAEFTGQLKASAEIERFEWLDTSDMHRISTVDKIIFSWLKERNLIH
jgi:ADP-ribose pyrophosphatase YjhB (NUDIX family)